MVNYVAWNHQRYWGTFAGLWGLSTRWPANLHSSSCSVPRPASSRSGPKKTILIITLKNCLGISVPPLPKATISSRPSLPYCSTPAILCPDLQSNPNLRPHSGPCSMDLEANCSAMRRSTKCCLWSTVRLSLRRMMRKNWVRRTPTPRRYFSCTMTKEIMQNWRNFSFTQNQLCFYRRNKWVASKNLPWISASRPQRKMHRIGRTFSTLSQWSATTRRGKDSWLRAEGQESSPAQPDSSTQNPWTL